MWVDTEQNEQTKKASICAGDHGKFLKNVAVQIRSSAPFLSTPTRVQSLQFPNKTIGTGPDRAIVCHEFESGSDGSRSRLGIFGVDRCGRVGHRVRSRLLHRVLVNNSKRPLLLLAGEIVTGGKQDRVIAKDRIVPAGGDPVDLSVFCIEPGRWTESSEKFGATAKTSTGTFMV